MARRKTPSQKRGATPRGAAKLTAGVDELKVKRMPGSFRDVCAACHKWLMTNDKNYKASQEGPHPFSR